MTLNRDIGVHLHTNRRAGLRPAPTFGLRFLPLAIIAMIHVRATGEACLAQIDANRTVCRITGTPSGSCPADSSMVSPESRPPPPTGSVWEPTPTADRDRSLLAVVSPITPIESPSCSDGLPEPRVVERHRNACVDPFPEDCGPAGQGAD